MKPLVTTMTVALALVMSTAGADDAEQTIRERIAQLAPDVETGRIEPSPLPGLYSVIVGSEVYFMTGDGRYLLHGDLVDLERQTSLTEAVRRDIRRDRLDALGDDQFLVFSPDGEPRHRVAVVTDIDCPYCRQMHQQMEGYLAAGIEIRYLMLPRAGVESDSYDKAVSAWCADDPHDAMTRAKRGESIPRANCDNPVDEHMALVRELGIRSTPTMVTERGTAASGFRPPEALLEMLKAEADNSVER